MKDLHPRLEQLAGLLNAEYEKGGWWQKCVDMPGVFVGLREQGVVAYWRGFLLLQIDMADGKLQVRAREKALYIHSSRSRVLLDESETHSKNQAVRGLDGLVRYLPQVCKQAELLTTPPERLASRIGSRLLGTLACNFECKNKVVDLVTVSGEGQIRGICIRPYASGELRGNRPRILAVLRNLNQLWEQEGQNTLRLFQEQAFLWSFLRGGFFQARRNVKEPSWLRPDIALLITEFDSVQREYGLPELVSALDGLSPICVGKPDNVNERHLAV